MYNAVYCEIKTIDLNHFLTLRPGLLNWPQKFILENPQSKHLLTWMSTKSSTTATSPRRSPLRQHSVSTLASMSQDRSTDFACKALTASDRSSETPSAHQHALSTDVFSRISPFTIRSVDPPKIASFLKERERYAMEVSAKRREITTLTHVPYVASIDRSMLKSLIYMGKIESRGPGIQNCIYTN